MVANPAYTSEVYFRCFLPPLVAPKTIISHILPNEFHQGQDIQENTNKSKKQNKILHVIFQSEEHVVLINS